MARSDMSDLEWEFIKAVLPNKSRGVKRVDDRRVINGIFYVLRTGIPWRDLPEQYGPYTTIYNRFHRWSRQGVWFAVFEALTGHSGAWGAVAIDSTSIKVHRSAAGAKGGPSSKASAHRAGGAPARSTG